MGTLNGGVYDYQNVAEQNIFCHRDGYESKVVTVKQGQVLKRRSFLQSIASGADKGKVIAHAPLGESAVVTFAAITAAQTLILGGLTFTAGTGGTSVDKLVTIWGGLNAGVTATAATAALAAQGIDTVVDGSFTVGTLTGWEVAAFDANSVVFTSNAGLSNVADLADTGTATDPIIAKVDGSTTFATIAGVTIYDVDATAGDVEVAVFTEASFWADALTWAVDPASDTIELADGTTRACTAYNTGTLAGDFITTRRLQSQFVEGSEFSHLGFMKEGERNNG